MTTADSSKNRGNFIALLESRAEMDETLRKHLESAALNARYMSKTIQDQVIGIIGSHSRNQIVVEVRKVGVFAVIGDEVTDNFANQEVLSVCLRYFNEEKMKIEEQFFDFRHLTRITGEAVADEILQSLHENNLDPAMLRGQAYEATIQPYQCPPAQLGCKGG